MSPGAAASPRYRRAGRRPGPRSRRVGARLHGPGNRGRESGHRHALDAQRAQAALPRVEWEQRRPQLQLVGRDSQRRRLVRSELPGAVRRQRPRQPHDRDLDRRRRRGEPDRRCSWREVDRVPQHGRGRRHSPDLHGVLPVLHRAHRPERPEPESGLAPTRDQQQLALPGERRVRARHAPDGRRERAGRWDLRRGGRWRRWPQLQHDL